MNKTSYPETYPHKQSVWTWIYNRLAGLYDSVDWLTFNTTHNYRRKVLPHLPESTGKLLEIGVGTGKLHKHLAQQHPCFGIDRAMGMLRKTAYRVRDVNQSPRLSQADAVRLPWRSASFNIIASTFVFSAIPDIGQLLRECDRVLEPGGVLLIIDAGYAEDGNWFAHLLAKSWDFLGDFVRDERPFLRDLGYEITYQEFAPKGCVHLVCARKPG